jgi:DinB superfamily
MTNDAALRQHVIDLLTGGNAHATFDDAVADLPAALRGKVPTGAEHSPWQLVEHLRIAQWDILEFSRDPHHKSPPWPGGYWPAVPEPPGPRAWDKTVAAFRKDLKQLSAMAGDESVDLFAKIPHGDGQTVLRELLLAADHNAYHVGQLILVRRLLGAWK